MLALLLTHGWVRLPAGMPACSNFRPANLVKFGFVRTRSFAARGPSCRATPHCDIQLQSRLGPRQGPPTVGQARRSSLFNGNAVATATLPIEFANRELERRIALATLNGLFVGPVSIVRLAVLVGAAAMRAALATRIRTTVAGSVLSTAVGGAPTTFCMRAGQIRQYRNCNRYTDKFLHLHTSLFFRP